MSMSIVGNGGLLVVKSSVCRRGVWWRLLGEIQWARMDRWTVESPLGGRRPINGTTRCE